MSTDSGQKGADNCRILLVGCQRDTPSEGSGACTARTGRFHTALARAGIRTDVVSPAEGRKGAAELRRLFASGGYSAAVLISPFPAETALLAGTRLPVWIDMNGMHPAEVQLSAMGSGRSGELMLRMLALENLLLAGGDMFSTPSRRQSYAVLGELFLLGRYDPEAADLVPVVPLPHCALPGVGQVEGPGEGDPPRIISTGSFGQWFDEGVLFEALESAMDGMPGLRFTCTGGEIPSGRGKYRHFLEMVSASRHRDRFETPGWVGRGELEDIYSRATMAVYTDVPGCETILGARTRALDWISRGIPVVCTAGAEVSEDIDRHLLGTVVRQQDSGALREAFIEMASSRELRERVRASQAAWCDGPGSMDRIFGPLVEWCRSPAGLGRRPTGRKTVGRLDSPGYLAALFGEVVREKGIGAGLYRVLEKLVPPVRRMRSGGRSG